MNLKSILSNLSTESIKQSIKNAIRYYSIYYLFALGIGMLIVKHILNTIICSYISFEPFTKLFLLGMNILVPLLWVIISFTYIREKRYRKLTHGRSYYEDSREFGKSYVWLVRYFKKTSL